LSLPKSTTNKRNGTIKVKDDRPSAATKDNGAAKRNIFLAADTAQLINHVEPDEATLKH
jgi:hypothetical protein